MRLCFRKLIKSPIYNCFISFGRRKTPSRSSHLTYSENPLPGNMLNAVPPGHPGDNNASFSQSRTWFQERAQECGHSDDYCLQRPQRLLKNTIQTQWYP
jgi:hypothetical protein